MSAPSSVPRAHVSKAFARACGLEAEAVENWGIRSEGVSAKKEIALSNKTAGLQSCRLQAAGLGPLYQA